MQIIFEVLFDEYSRVKWQYVDHCDGLQVELFPQIPGRSDTDISIVAHHKSIFRTSVGQRKHRHEGFVLNYAYKGRFQIEISEEYRTLEQGDIYIIHPDVSQCVKYVSESDDSIMVTVFIKKELMAKTIVNMLPKRGGILDFALKPFFEERSTEYIIANCIDDRFVKNSFEIMLSEYVLNDTCSDKLIQCALSMILGLVGRKRFAQLGTSELENHFVTELLGVIEKNQSIITLDVLAKHFNYNRNYLSAKIRKETGATYSDLLSNVRIRRSCFLLLNTDYPIPVIAQTIGFRHPSSFHKAFKSKLGMSPQEFRKNGALD